MKKELFFGLVMLACTAGVSLGATLFVHNFDNINGATLEDRLTADYAVGSRAPTSIVQEGNPPTWPDVFAGSGTTLDPYPKFGDGLLRTRQNAGSAANTLLTYSIDGNLNVNKGTFEAWVYSRWQSDNARIFSAGLPGQSYGEFIHLFGHSSGTYKFQVKSHPGGTARIITSPDNTHLNHNNPDHPGWQLLGVEWDFTSDSANNYMRMYLDGEKVDELSGIPAFYSGEGDPYINNHTQFGLGTYPYLGTSNWPPCFRGAIDSVRITDNTMAELYVLDANGNYTPQTTAFVPEPASLALLLLGGGLAWRRRRVA